MDIHVLQLIIDFGLVILIWLVQLVIYPGFLFYSKQNLSNWHSIYTIRITYVVMPLMLLQLVLGIWNCILTISLFTISYLVLILLVWLSTFLQFVPRHQKIASNEFDVTLLKELVNKNWIRTILWCVIFLMNYLFG